MGGCVVVDDAVVVDAVDVDVVVMVMTAVE